MNEKRPGVGVGIMILRDGKVLLGKRNDDPIKASSLLHGEGTWTMPGGKLDFRESLHEGAIREVLEETDLRVKGLELMSLNNDMTHENHFVTIGFLCKYFEGEPKIMEPEEIVEWKWFPIEKPPERIFPPTKKMLENYLKKKIYMDGE